MLTKRKKSPFFPTEIEARREIDGIGLVNKQHYQKQLIEIDLLDDPQWQANIDAKQGCFQLDRYRHFAFQRGNILFNPISRDNEWIPNATYNLWANCPSQSPKQEHHVIHTLGH